jgi:hypothetical protein
MNKKIGKIIITFINYFLGGSPPVTVVFKISTNRLNLGYPV